MLKSKTKFFIALVPTVILILLVIAPQIAAAKGLVPCGGEGEARCNVYHIFYLIAVLTNWLIAMAGVYAVYVIVQASWWMAASQGDEEALTTKRKQLVNAILGFCLVLLSFMIVNSIVNFFLLRQIKNPECRINLANPFKFLGMSWEDIEKCKSSSGL